MKTNHQLFLCVCSFISAVTVKSEPFSRNQLRTILIKVSLPRSGSLHAQHCVRLDGQSGALLTYGKILTAVCVILEADGSSVRHSNQNLHIPVK